MRRRSTARMAFVVFAIAPVLAGSETKITIGPGPSAMAPEEVAIVADPSAGAQHGVILLEEADKNEDRGTSFELTYHVRAKILSAEGRKLADVEIPGLHAESDLKSWWGRTIFADGRSVELRREDLKAQLAAKAGFVTYKTMKAALPGVVPGCLIDYGYVISGEGYTRSEQLFLQKEWPVKQLRYRWTPSSYLPASYVASHTAGKPIEITRDKNSVLVTAHDLSPVAEEPLMPPLGEVRASVTFYYSESNEDADEFWNLSAKRIETRLKSFLGNGSVVHEILSGIDMPQGAPLHDRLRAAYDWIEANVKNLGLLSAEEEERHDDSRDDDAYNAKTVLKARQGTGRQLDQLFAGIARALGAEADIAYATDRTEQFWNRGLKSMSQFAYTFVAVRAPGEPDDALVFVDAGSGLPYGQVPWAATGGTAFVCTPKGALKHVIPPSPPKWNRVDTLVTAGFSPGNETRQAKWSRKASGAPGMEWRRWFRDLNPKERTERLDESCRGSGGSEVLAAELPGLDDVRQPFQIACDLEMGESNITDDIGRYSYSFMGPWWPETPSFPAPTRSLAVIFKYPKADIVSIDVKAPEGFRSKTSPAPVKLDSAFGKYQLFVAKTEAGYHVDRALAVVPLVVEVPDYAALRAFFDEVAKNDRTLLEFDRVAAQP